MKHFKQFMKDLEATPEEESTEEEVETKGETKKEEDEIKEYGPDSPGYSDAERARDAWMQGDDHYAHHKKANPRIHKKVPVKKKGMQIPKGHIPKDSSEKARDKFYAEK